MECRCPHCDHEWIEHKFFNHRKCPSCRVMVYTTKEAHPLWRRVNRQTTPPPQAAHPAPAVPVIKPGALPPIINEKKNLGVIEEQDHTYRGLLANHRLRHRDGRKPDFPI